MFAFVQKVNKQCCSRRKRERIGEGHCPYFISSLYCIYINALKRTNVGSVTCHYAYPYFFSELATALIRLERFRFDYHYRYRYLKYDTHAQWLPKPVAIVVSFRLSTVTNHFKVVVRTFSQVSCFGIFYWYLFTEFYKKLQYVSIQCTVNVHFT